MKLASWRRRARKAFDVSGSVILRAEIFVAKWLVLLFGIIGLFIVASFFYVAIIQGHPEVFTPQEVNYLAIGTVGLLLFSNLVIFMAEAQKREEQIEELVKIRKLLEERVEESR